MATLRLSQVNHLYHVESDLEYLKNRKKEHLGQFEVSEKKFWSNLKILEKIWLSD